MNQSNQEFLVNYRSFFLFLCKNKTNFYINITESDEDSDVHFYNFEIFVDEDMIPFYPFYLKLEFSIVINFEELSKAYDSLNVDPNIKYLKEDLSKSHGFFTFIEREWNQIIMHLMQFNQIADDYDVIAKLLHNFRGGIKGINVYGI